jgi:hypothetical protein
MTQHHLALIIGLAILNGIFSPALIAVFALYPVWYPAFLPAILPVMFALSSVIVATLTLMNAPPDTRKRPCRAMSGWPGCWF